MLSDKAIHAPVCVLGMGRSGTSLTTRVIGMLGIELGPADTMLPAHPLDNLHGYWEQAAIKNLNDDLLAELGGTWNQPPSLQQGWHRDARLAQLRQRARNIADRHIVEGTRWGWKDPRTSLTLPFWRDIVGEMLYVICFRSPTEVADSLLARDPGLHPRQDTMSLWLRYSGEALCNTAGERRLLVSFEDWFDRPEQQLERLAGFLSNGDRDDCPDGWMNQALAFLDEKARHHESRATKVVADNSVPADVRLFYIALRHLAVHQSEREFEVGLHLLSEWWEARQERHNEVDRLRSRVAHIEADLEAHRDWLASIQSSLTWRSTAFLRHLKRGARSIRRQAGRPWNHR
jgi:hypothetical protein